MKIRRAVFQWLVVVLVPALASAQTTAVRPGTARTVNGTQTTDTATARDLGGWVVWRSTQAATKTQLLPPCNASFSGRSIGIVDGQGNAAQYPINIGAAASLSINANHGTADLVCDGYGTWFQVAGGTGGGGQVGSVPAVIQPPELSTSNPVIGQALTVASNGNWTQSPTGFALQWNRNGNAISGATAAAYTPTMDDAGQRLSVTVIASNANGPSEPSRSSETDVIPDPRPVATIQPTISPNNPVIGVELTATTGSWSNLPGSPQFSYQWNHADLNSPISGATTATYTPETEDIGHTLSVTVTVESALGTGSATSAVTSAVASDIAPSHVASAWHTNGDVSSNTVTTTFPAPVGAGNALIVNVLHFGQATGCTDNQNNPYTFIRSDRPAGYQDYNVSTYWRPNITNAPTAITCTIASPNIFSWIWVDQFSGLGTYARIDAHTATATMNMAPPTLSSGTITTNEPSLIYGTGTILLGNGTLTPGPGFTQGLVATTALGSPVNVTQWKMQDEAGPVAATWTPSTTGPAVANVIAIEPRTQPLPPPVNTAAPGIAGSPFVGSTLVATAGGWTNDPEEINYQWNSIAPGGASTSVGTQPNYTVQQSDLGHHITVTATAANASGSSQPATSTQFGPITDAPPLSAIFPAVPTDGNARRPYVSLDGTDEWSHAGLNAIPFVGSISGTTLTVTNSYGNNALGPTQEISGPGVTPGTKITAFGANTTGDTGTYTVSSAQNVGSVAMRAKGIPYRSTVHQTLSPNGTDDTAAISSALASCPNGQVVKLTAGVFKVTGWAGIGIRNGCTLRGAGPGQQWNTAVNGLGTRARDPNLAGQRSCPSGSTMTSIAAPEWDHVVFCTDPTATQIVRTVRGWSTDNYVMSIAKGGANNSAWVNLRQDMRQGDKILPLSGSIGAQVGDIVHFDVNTRFDPNVYYWGGGFVGARRSWNGGTWENANDWGWLYQGAASYGGRNSRSINQYGQVMAVNGNDLTLDTPAGYTYQTQHAAQAQRVELLRGAGIEDVFVAGGSNTGNIIMQDCAYCWIKNVEAASGRGPSIWINRGAFRSVLRDSYIHENTVSNPGGAGYNFTLQGGSTENLIENNIMWNGNKNMTAHTAGPGNVVAYNFLADPMVDYDPDFAESGLNLSHWTTPFLELMEGNESHRLTSETRWGSTITSTFFRNHATMVRPAYHYLRNFGFQQGGCTRRYMDASGRVAVEIYGGFPNTNQAPTGGFGAALMQYETQATAPNGGYLTGGGLPAGLPSDTVNPASPQGMTRNGGSYAWNIVGNVFGRQNMQLNEGRAGGANICNYNTENSFNEFQGQSGSGYNVNTWNIGRYTDVNHTWQYDPTTLSTVVRLGNWDWSPANGTSGAPIGQRWFNVGTNTSNPSLAVPLPNSLYLTSKPAFFGSQDAWPWLDPTNGAINTLPAKYCFEHDKMPTCRMNQ